LRYAGIARVIVKTATFKEGRTIWRFETERADDVVPQNRLWIDGYFRAISPKNEAAWLSMTLAPFVHSHLVLPGPVPTALRERLETVFGFSILADESATSDRPDDGKFSATMIRDEVDVIFSRQLRSGSQMTVWVGSDPRGVRFDTMEPRIVSNGGQLRRGYRMLDGIGELGVLWMLCPTVSVSCLVSFLCRDEIGGINPEDLVGLAAQFGIELHLPFAGVEAAALGRVMTDFGIPPVTTFRCLWDRYKTNAAVMTKIYRDLHPRLATSGISDASVRICDAMAKVLKTLPDADGISNDIPDRSYFLYGRNIATLQA
jgi:hypothetical protein